ncbi:hypothetical protein HacjB3_09695 [Halalkalicoccus jeotgali B3]|nr:hypothetical protein HacjB3_09695 [Halalkalicoccus jeotgali B3]
MITISMASEDATERTTVKTYVPKYQKEIWKEDAEDFDMSQSEFIRTMVQAGRRGFNLEQPKDTSSDANPRGNGVKEGVLNALQNEVHTWDELLSKMSEGIEDRLEESLQELQENNRIQYSGRLGGYKIVDNE